jgi:hypothetical protein
MCLWECLLQESRIMLVSKNLEILTSAIASATGMINPFTWQHILIPVLPQSMLDYCTAPMPFLIGVLAYSLPQILLLPLEEVFIFNLDEGTLLTPGSSREIHSIFPKSVRANLFSSLDRVFKVETRASRIPQAQPGYLQKYYYFNLQNSELIFYFYFLNSC